MNSELGLISLAASLTVLALYSACSDYQEEFDSNFGALTYESYLDTSSVDLSSATDHFSSNAEEMSSGAVPVSSSVYSLSSSLQDELSSSSEEKKESSSSVEESSSSSVKSSSSSQSSSSSVESLNSKKCKDPENKCIVDSRDDQVYDTVQIGNQIWMAQNLNYRTDDSYCYNAIDAQITNEYCETYGRLYRIKKTLEMTDGVCPEGWHVPSKDEWTTLFKTVGGQVHAGVHLKSKTGWQGGSSDVSGKDDFGFTALPGGLGHSGSGYQFEGINAWFLTTSMSDSKECPTCMAIVNLFFSTEDAIFDPRVGEEAVSVRCVMDGVTD